MNFNLKEAAILQAVTFNKNPLFKLRKPLKSLSFVLTLVFLVVFVFGILTEDIPEQVSENFLGGAMIGVCLGFLFWELDVFFNQKLKNPKLKYPITEAVIRKEDSNLAAFLDYGAAKICQQTLKMVKRRGLEKPPAEFLLYLLLTSKNEELDFIFNRGALDREKIKNNLKRDFLKIEIQNEESQSFASTKSLEDAEGDFEKIILAAAKVVGSRKKKRIGVGDILIAFAAENPYFEKFLVESDFTKEDIENLVFWYERVQEELALQKRFWERDNLLKKGSIGKDWAAGYTVVLDKYSLDLREKLRRTGFREIIGHQKEVKQVERVLEKEEINNVLLVGEPGTGRGSIVEALTQRAFFARSSPKVNNKRALKFDIVGLAAAITSQEEVEAVLDKCFAETVRAGNVILVIDEFHNFVSEAFKPGTINIAGILSRYLPLSTFQIIAITSYSGLHEIIERNPSLLSFFEKVEVSEISLQETLIFLENYVPLFEKKHQRFISYRALREILKLSSRYLTQIPFPEKAIRLLDEAMTYLALYTKDPILREWHIKKVVSEKTEIPLEDVEAKEKEVLLNLEELVHQRIINQEEAVKEVSSALRRARAEIQRSSRPIGSFLFLGPTGVGKTETSKAISAVYFGSEKRMIRLDMSEFQNIDDIKRLLGGTLSGDGFLTTPVRENPFSLVLLDEVEKAHLNILNLFLQVLDEGWVTDGFGRKVDFQNTIIIATSNAGSEVIREEIEKNKELQIIKEELLDYVMKKGIFRPEFINRFDAVVVFKPLTKENLLDIAHLMLKKLGQNLKDKGIELEITKEIKEKIVELSYKPVFGAREMRRVMQDKVENVLAQAILSGKLKRGDRVKINPEGFGLLINMVSP